MSEKKCIILPANDAVQNWFEENIDKKCSALSAVYKFRQWLESQQPFQSGPIWVKASDRLPGLNTPVKWRFDEVEREGKYSLSKMTALLIDLYGWEWLDESAPTIANNEIIAALQKFVSRHEAGLLPDRGTYEQAKKALEG